MTLSPRLPVALGAGLATVALVAACSSSAHHTAASRSAAGISTRAVAAPAVGGAVTAKLSEFAIALSATHLTAGAHTFTVKNTGGIVHAFEIDGKGVDDKSTSDLAPGKSATLTVTLKAGRYEVFCPVGNHREQGMDATLQVG